MSTRRSLIMVGVAVAGVGLLAWQVARAGHYESPPYTVIESFDGWEVREYAPRLEARVTVEGPYRTAVSDGFRILAGFIFGGNQGREKVAMTIPVTAEPQAPGERIAMTVPVTATPETVDAPMEAGRWTITFMMPSRFTAETLPVPNDPRIEIVQTAPERVAARSFRWRATTSRSAMHIEALLADLHETGLDATGPPRVAQYDGPWVLGPLRNNDVLVPIGPTT